MGLESFIPGGGQILDFFRGSQKDFPGWAKNGEIWFCPLETTKTAFFC